MASLVARSVKKTRIATTTASFLAGLFDGIMDLPKLKNPARAVQHDDANDRSDHQVRV